MIILPEAPEPKTRAVPESLLPPGILDSIGAGDMVYAQLRREREKVEDEKGIYSYRENPTKPQEMKVEGFRRKKGATKGKTP